MLIHITPITIPQIYISTLRTNTILTERFKNMIKLGFILDITSNYFETEKFDEKRQQISR